MNIESLYNQLNEGQKNLLNCIQTEKKELFIDFYKKWRETQDFEALDFDSLLLFPLLYDKIERFDIVDENLPRYKGIIKKNWVVSSTNEKYLFKLRESLVELEIPFLFYDEYVINSVITDFKYPLKFSSISILVNPTDIKKVIQTIKSLGGNQQVFSNLKRTLLVRNFVSFDLNKTKVNVYYRPLRNPLKSQYLNNLLSNSRIEHYIQDENVTLFVYYLILKSQTEFSEPKINWIIYLFMIEKKYKIDWNTFVNLTINDNTKLIILPAYYTLFKMDSIKFPEFVLNKLYSSKTSWKCKVEFYFASKPKSFFFKLLKIAYDLSKIVIFKFQKQI